METKSADYQRFTKYTFSLVCINYAFIGKKVAYWLLIGKKMIIFADDKTKNNSAWQKVKIKEPTIPIWSRVVKETTPS